MHIYKSQGEPKEYKTTINPLEDLEKKDWDYLGDLPSRISVLRNPTKVNLTKKEIEEHLYLTKELLNGIIKNIEQIELKI
ncbi:MAG: hypothetical protein KKB25_02655 [Nanoarchaeota archaeon]|nr:hypothetical protein [Nanoarchaeota archaeon]